METKICSKCNEEKNICEFNKEKRNKSGLKSECKLCRKLIKKKHYDTNKHKILENKKKYYLSKKDVILEKAKKFNDYYKLNYQINVLYRIGKIVRRRIYDYVTKNTIKIEKTFDIVGCSSELLKAHLEQKFIKGMSWENQGEWHIDHIIPLSSAKSEEEVYKLCHYTNLQPLWAQDNLSKGSKII
jgi:hypothetical protein